MRVPPVKEKRLLRSEGLESWACLPAVGPGSRLRQEKKLPEREALLGGAVCAGSGEWRGGRWIGREGIFKTGRSAFVP